VVLFSAVGFVLYHFLGWGIALPLLVFAGLLFAPLVPVKGGGGGCGSSGGEDGGPVKGPPSGGE